MDNQKAPSKLVLVCAWCKRMPDGGGTWREGRRLAPGEEPTHGICPDCLEKQSDGDREA